MSAARYRAGLSAGVALALMSFAGTAVAGPTSKEEAFIAADRNGDRVLDRSELRIFIGHMAELGETRAKRVRMLGLYGLAMRTIDTDKDGVASIAELRAQDGK